MILNLLLAEPPGLAPLLPEKYYFVRLNALPDPFELRSFCRCAIGESGTGCMRRPRYRAPRRRRGTRSAGSRNDDGGGGDDGTPLTGLRESSSEWRAA